MIYFFALLALVTFVALWRIGTALWTAAHLLRTLGDAGVQIHNVWYGRATELQAQHDRAEVLRS